MLGLPPLPFLRGEGWGEGRNSIAVPLTPSLSAEVGFIRLRPNIGLAELGYTRVRLPQERGEGVVPICGTVVHHLTEVQFGDDRDALHGDREFALSFARTPAR